MKKKKNLGQKFKINVTNVAGPSLHQVITFDPLWIQSGMQMLAFSTA